MYLNMQCLNHVAFKKKLCCKKNEEAPSVINVPCVIGECTTAFI